MTRDEKSNLVAEAVQMVLEGLGPAVSVLLNEAMRIERHRALAAEPGEQTPERKGYANGYKPPTLKTRLRKFDIQVPGSGESWSSIRRPWNTDRQRTDFETGAGGNL